MGQPELGCNENWEAASLQCNLTDRTRLGMNPVNVTSLFRSVPHCDLRDPQVLSELLLHQSQAGFVCGKFVLFFNDNVAIA